MLKKNKKIIIIIFFVILCAIIYFMTSNTFSEYRMMLLYKTNLNLFKYKYFYQLEKNGQQLYMLGTIHDKHWIEEDYSLLHIKAVINNLKPDLLLVESRPSELESGNLADGPLEMLYAHLNALSLGIEVNGVDWWTPENSKPGTTFPERDDKIVDNIIKASKGHEKVLVLLGCSHVIFDIPRLKKAGYKLVPFSRQKKKTLFEHDNVELNFPDKMQYYIRKRINIEKSLIGTVYNDEMWTKRIKNLIRGLENYIKFIEKHKNK